MSSLPEHDPLNPEDLAASAEVESLAPQQIESLSPIENLPPPAPVEPTLADQSLIPAPAPIPAPALTPDIDPPLFQSFSYPPPRPPVRIPHFGHLLLLIAVLALGLLVTGVLMGLAVQKHFLGVTTTQGAIGDIRYVLGSEAVLYLSTFGIALFVFPLFWHKSLLAGLQWNASTALRLRWRLVSAAFVCFILAIVGGEFMHNPTNTPIEEAFRTPGAAWLLFVFGVTFAPFFEETFFRGFLLPSLCTAYDWFAEKTTHQPVPPLGPNGHPQWSLSAMAVASILTSLPFAWMHGAQTGYALGPFLLLVGVSMVLCIVRLSTRSLASSILVHASYNFMLFTLMLIGTGGFRHMDKM